MVFLSPSRSHEIWDRCSHIISSLYNISSIAAAVLLASALLSSSIIPFSSARRVLSSSIFRRTDPNFSQLLLWSDCMTPLRAEAKDAKDVFAGPLSHASMMTSPRDCSLSHIISYCRIFGFVSCALAGASLNKIGQWSEHGDTRCST